MAVATTGTYTLQQLFRVPFILKLISRIRATGQPISGYYNMGVGQAGDIAVPAGQRTFGYDIYDNTRRIAGVKPAKTPPTRRRAQKLGTNTGTILRAYESLPVAWEDIVNMRPPGARIGVLDASGQQYVVKQVKTMTQTFMNMREWCVARMFRGGFDIKYNGDEWYLVDKGSGDYTVDFNKFDSSTGKDKSVDYGNSSNWIDYTTIGSGSGNSANQITTSWGSNGNVIGHLLAINKQQMRLTGWPIEIIWVNSTTMTSMLSNTTLQAIGGTSFRIWESMEWKQMKAIDGSSVYSGMDVRFRGAPQFLFKVYDGVLQKGGALADSTSIGETDLVIPDNYAIMTPRPGDWIGFAEGSEPQQKTLGQANVEILKGFNTWQRPMLDPAGVELCFLDNFFPIPFNPAAWLYLKVV